MPSGTTIEITTTRGTVVGASKFAVSNTNVNPNTGGTRETTFATAITDADTAKTGTGKVTVKILTPKGNETSLVFSIEG